MSSLGSAKRRMSPGISAPKSRGIRWPARACSREVRGSWMPCLANTYRVKPEQSKPLCGVLPPQTYGTPTYLSAVSSTRAATAVAAGDRGMRTPDVREDPELLEPDDLVFPSIASPIITAAEMTLAGESDTIPCAQAERRSSDDASAGRGKACGRGGRRQAMPVARQL